MYRATARGPGIGSPWARMPSVGFLVRLIQIQDTIPSAGALEDGDMPVPKPSPWFGCPPFVGIRSHRSPVYMSAV